jgi:DNA helicase-2/ATP-dependent DNA helicase PcrA
LKTEDILEGLNREQREAVLNTEGPLLILAGAGSGKTRVLTHRLAYILRAKGVPPQRLLAITFTNKAAEEMKNRLRVLVGRVSEAMWVSTFHAACMRVLRRDAEKLGFKRNFVVYDEDDQRRLVAQLMKDNDIDTRLYPPRAIHARISTAKNELVDADALRREARGEFEMVTAEIYRLYQEGLFRNNAMDFDDILIHTLALFDLYPVILEEYQEKFLYISIDEYQDTNRAQYRWVNLLAARHRNLCVVGDDDQSIYSWRGADLRNLLDFERDYPDAKVIRLERNYRSTGTILEAAHGVVVKIKGRKPKKLWTDRGGGHPLKYFRASSGMEEAIYVVNEISKLVAGGKYALKDIAVFYRTNAQSRLFEEIMLRFNLPYKIVGGYRFYERREIKDLISYLKVLVNPDDGVSLRRIINVPRRGIGDTTLGHLEDFARLQGISLYEALSRAGEVPRLGTGAVKKIKAFLGLLDDLRRDMQRVSLTELVRQVQVKSGYLQELKEERSIEAEGRIENLEEFGRVAAEFESAHPGGSLEEFLEQTSLISDIDLYDEEEGAVTLMTLHNAKGLEFPVVFMVGMEEGIFPHLRSIMERGDDEERRLCYVGLTRAKDLLYLTSAATRDLYGGVDRTRESRFIHDIPEECLEVVGGGELRDLVEERERLEAERLAAGFQMGDLVRHALWGEGRVTQVTISESGPEVMVEFPHLGTKRLHLAYAPLTRIERG